MVLLLYIQVLLYYLEHVQTEIFLVILGEYIDDFDASFHSLAIAAI